MKFFLLSCAFIFCSTPALSEESAEIVVSAYRACSIAGLQGHTAQTPLKGGLGQQRDTYEINTFSGTKYSLSCEGKPGCQGNIFLAANSDVEVTRYNEQKKIKVSIVGDTRICRKNPKEPDLNENCFTKIDERPSGRVGIMECKPEDPKNPVCMYKSFQMYPEVNYEDILDAQESRVSITCAPPDCEAVILNNHRRSQARYGNNDNDLLILRKDRNGNKKAQLIVGASSVAVYTDDHLNLDKNSARLKPCYKVNRGQLTKDLIRRGILAPQPESSKGPKKQPRSSPSSDAHGAS